MNRLRELRLEKGLLQSDIAKIINKGERTVGFYETGERDMGTETLSILSDFFEVTIDYLLGKTNERNPKETDTLGLAKIGFSMKDYNPPTETQKQQIKCLLEVIMKDNKKDNKEQEMEENEIENKIVQNKNEAISEVNKYLDTCLLSDEKHIKKANLISYWLKDYIKYIEQEEVFDSSLLKEYSRGDVIKVNLGFNVGNEEGGLHYCIVLDKKNVKSYSTLTVIPLTSVKPWSKPHKTSVFLGNDIYKTLQKKNTEIINTVKCHIDTYTDEIEKLYALPEETEEERIIKDYKIQQISNIIISDNEKLDLFEKIKTELNQMKTGTIALINQITTISKQRIYNPKKELDILSGIKVSDEKMKLIDEKIKKLFIN